MSDIDVVEEAEPIFIGPDTESDGPDDSGDEVEAVGPGVTTNEDDGPGEPPISPDKMTMGDYAAWRRGEELPDHKRKIHVSASEAAAKAEAKVYREAMAGDLPVDLTDAVDMKARVTASVARGRERYSDFDAVFNNEVPISEAAAFGMAKVSNVDDVAYHLGKNRDLAAKISGMGATEAVMEIGKLSRKLEAKNRPKATSAPAPARTVRSGAAISGRTLAGAKTMEDYARLRRQMENDR